MAKAVNFTVKVNDAGSFLIVVSEFMKKKGVLSGTGKSNKIAYVDEGYGNFMKLDDVNPKLKGYMLQFQLLRTTKTAGKSTDDEDDGSTSTKKNKTNKNKKTEAQPAKRGRGRPPKNVEPEDIDEDVAEEGEDIPAPKRGRPSKAAPAKTTKKGAKSGKATSRRK